MKRIWLVLQNRNEIVFYGPYLLCSCFPYYLSECSLIPEGLDGRALKEGDQRKEGDQELRKCL